MANYFFSSLFLFLAVFFPFVLSITLQCDSSLFEDSASAFTVSGCQKSLRKDWNSLTTNQHNAFLNALVDFSNSGMAKSFACYHYKDMAKGNFHTINGVRQYRFLLWHRTFLLHLESLIGMPIPYWAFDLAANDIWNSPVFSSTSFGEKSGPNLCVDLSSSPLRNLNLTDRSIYDDNCIKRNGQGRDGPISGFQWLLLNFGSPIFEIFMAQLDPVHGLYHSLFGAGGYMFDHGSARDPIFWLFHANFDRLFYLWQRIHPYGIYNFGQNLPGYPLLSINDVWISTCTDYDDPYPNPPVNSATDSAVSELSESNTDNGVITRRKRQISDSCFGPLARLFNGTLLPPRSYFLNFYRDDPPNSLAVFLQSIVGSYTNNEDLFTQAYNKLRYNQFWEFHYQVASVLEGINQCSGNILFEQYGAKRFERGFLMTNFLSTLRNNPAFRCRLDDIATIIFRGRNLTLNTPSTAELTKAGQELISLALSTIGASSSLYSPPSPSPVTFPTPAPSPIITKRAAPFDWSCPESAYGTGDGCDCGCGAADPDCDDQQVRRTTFFATRTPIWRCNLPNVECNRGFCNSNGVVPDGWICDPTDYNSTNGCNCGCGAYDPDCDTLQPTGLEDVAPFIYEITGCPNGKAVCSINGTCLYITPQVPSEWICAHDRYNSSDACDCDCGAYDPDCDYSTLTVVNCPCEQMTCKNVFGYCTGTCPNGGTLVLGNSNNSTTVTCPPPTPCPTGSNCPTCPPSTSTPPSPPTPCPSQPTQSKGTMINLNFGGMLGGNNIHH